MSKTTDGKILTPKRKKFARLVVKTGSKTKAYRAAFDVGPNTLPSTVHEEASRTASIPQVKNEIERLFERNGLSFDDVTRLHERNMSQDKHLPTSQKAITDYYELTGRKKAAQSNSVSIAFVINRGDTQEGVEVRHVDATPLSGAMLDATHEDDSMLDDDSTA